MKTLEEIKKGLAEAPHVKYVVDDQSRDDVHYERYGVAIGYILRDQIYIHITQLESRLAQVERERDAALKDIANTCWSCRNAKPSQLTKFLYSCPHLKGKAGVRTQCENWQWRGVCPENTEEETDAD